MKKFLISAVAFVGAISLIVVALQAPFGLDSARSAAVGTSTGQGALSKLFKKNKPIQVKIQTMEAGLQEIWVPVLVYHHIGIPPGSYSSADKSLFIAPEWFEKHLQYLKDNGFETIRFSDVVAYFEMGMPLPLKPVIISFDDGNGNVYRNAFPLLKKYNMKGTLFLPSGFLDHGSHMTTDQVKEMMAAGMEIGSHTLTHPYLSKSSRAKSEIFDSKRILEEKLGTTITAFAYPFGDYNERIEGIVKDAGYKIARSFSTGDGISLDKMFHVKVVRVYANVGLDRWKKQLLKDVPASK